MSQTPYYLDHNGILQPGSQVTALIADVERLRAIVSAQNDRDMEKARKLDEAEALLRALDYDRPLVECQDFIHRKEDMNHPSAKCGPFNRWRATWEKIDAWLARRIKD